MTKYTTLVGLSGSLNSMRYLLFSVLLFLNLVGNAQTIRGIHVVSISSTSVDYSVETRIPNSVFSIVALAGYTPLYEINKEGQERYVEPLALHLSVNPRIYIGQTLDQILNKTKPLITHYIGINLNAIGSINPSYDVSISPHFGIRHLFGDTGRFSFEFEVGQRIGYSSLSEYYMQPYFGIRLGLLLNKIN